jgi:Methyltransferase domain
VPRHVISRLIDYSNPRSIASRLRAKRISEFIKLAAARGRTKLPVRVLDIGGTRDYWRIVPDSDLAALGLSITVVNLPGEPQGRDDEVFTFLRGDGCDLSTFPDAAFDLVHSNSVIEHVGDWSRMTAFATEVRRLAPAYYVQTPNFWFPLEPHYMRPFIHWIPEQVRACLLTVTRVGQYPRAVSMDQAMLFVQGNRLLTRPMLASLFPDARIMTERVALLPKSLMAIRAGAEPSRATTRA